MPLRRLRDEREFFSARTTSAAAPGRLAAELARIHDVAAAVVDGTLELLLLLLHALASMSSNCLSLAN